MQMTGNRVLVIEKCPDTKDLPPDDGFNVSEVKMTLLQHFGHMLPNLQFRSPFSEPCGHRWRQILPVFAHSKIKENMTRQVTLPVRDEKGIGAQVKSVQAFVFWLEEMATRHFEGPVA